MRSFLAAGILLVTFLSSLFSYASASYSEFDNITLEPNTTLPYPNATLISRTSPSVTTASPPHSSTGLTTSLPSSQAGVNLPSSAKNISTKYPIGSTSSVYSNVIAPTSSTTSSSSGIGGYVASGLGLSSSSETTSSAPSPLSTSIPTSQAGVRLTSVRNLTGVYPIGSTSSIYSSVIPIPSVKSLPASNSTRAFSTLRSIVSPSAQRNSSTSAVSPSKQTTASVQSVRPISSPKNGSTTALPYSLPVASNTTGNRTLDLCWAQWETYWGSQPATTIPAYSPSTSTVIFTFDSRAPSTIATTVVNTYTWTTASIVNGFTMESSTYTDTDTYTQMGTYTGQAASLVTTTSTYSMPLWNTNATTRVGQPPGCDLPSSVPQCQASWSSYASVMLLPSPQFVQCEDASPACSASISAVDSSVSIRSSLQAKPPLCTQASIGSSLCGSLRSSYVSAGFTNGEVATSVLNPLWYPDTSAGGVTDEASTVLIGGTAIHISYNSNGGSTVSSGWPSDSTLAPGCSLGCARCAITAGTVQLIHWPATATPSNGTMTGTNDGIVVATAMGTVFTSPTLYVSFENVYASDSCGAVGSTHAKAIVALPTSAELSSVWAENRPFSWIEHTASFNVTDLNPPVPLSIYSRQPWCGIYSASQQVGYAVDGGCNNQTDTEKCTPVCPMTRPYNPIIVLPEGVLNSLDPAWGSCSMDIRGAYDPPYLLTPATVAAVPSASATAAPESMSADPGSSPAPNTASVTASLASPSASPPASYTPPNVPASSVGPGPQSAVSKPRPASVSADPATATQDPGTVQPQPSQQSSAASNVLSILQGGSVLQGQSTAPDKPQPSSNPNPAAPATATQDPGTVQPQPGQQSSAASNVLSILQGGSVLQGQSAIPEQPQPSNNPVPADPSNAASNILSGLSSPSANTVQPAKASPPNNPAPITGNQPSPSSPAVIAGQTVSADPANSGAVIGGNTVLPGSVTSIQGTQISVGTSNVVIGGSSTVALAPADPPSEPSLVGNPSAQPIDPGNAVSDPASGISQGVSTGGLTPAESTSAAAIFTVGSSAYTASSGKPVVVGSATLITGGPAQTISGQSVTVGTAGVVIGGSSAAYSPVPVPVSPSDSVPAAVLTVAGQTYTAASGAPLVIGSSTLSAGAPALTSGGQTISVGSSGVNVDGSPVAYSQPPIPVTTAPPALVTFAGQTYTAASGAPLVIGSSTLSEGAPALTSGGQTISVGSSGVNVDGSPVAYSQPPISVTTAPAAVVTVGGQTYTAQSGGSVVIGGSTLSQGGAALTTGSQVISIGSAGVNVGGSDVAYSSAPAPAPAPASETGAVVTVGGNPYTIQSGSSAVIAGSKLSVGGSAATISGQVVSLGNAGVNVGSSAVAYSAMPGAQPQETAAVVTVGGTPYTVQSGSSAIIAGSTLSAGGPAATISGQVVSLGSSGVNVGSSAVAYSAIPSPQPLETAAVVTVGGQPLTIQSGSPMVIAGSTLSAGGPAMTISGQVVSLGSQGIEIGSSTAAYSTMPALQPQPQETAAIITAGGQTYTAQPGQPLIIAGSTLSPGGPPLTLAGTTFSAAPSGIVIDGTTTAPYSTFAAPSTGADLDAPFTINNTPYTAYAEPGSSGGFVVVAGPSGSILATLTPGGPATTLGGQVVSAAPLSSGGSGSGVDGGLVVGGSTVPFQTFAPSTEVEAPFTLDGTAHTAVETTVAGGAAGGSATLAVIDGSVTLTVGGAGTVVAGQSVSAGSAGLVFGAGGAGVSTAGWESVAVGPSGAPVPTIAGGAGAGVSSGGGAPTGTVGVSGGGGGGGSGVDSSSGGNKNAGWSFGMVVGMGCVGLTGFLWI